jgi:hypothetical protein
LARYRKSHIQKCRDMVSNWTKRNRARINKNAACRQRTPEARYYSVRWHSQKVGRKFNLTFSYYKEIISLPCYYCGGELPVVGSGLDRIDSNKGYIKGNVRPCCKVCNIAKNSMSESEFKAWLQHAFKHWACK